MKKILEAKIAQEASKQIVELQKKIKSNEELYTSLLSDYLRDIKDNFNFVKKIVFSLMLIIVISIGSMVALSIYHNEKFISFLSQNEILSEVYIDTEDSSLNNGSINITK